MNPYIKPSLLKLGFINQMYNMINEYNNEYSSSTSSAYSSWKSALATDAVTRFLDYVFPSTEELEVKLRVTYNTEVYYEFSDAVWEELESPTDEQIEVAVEESELPSTGTSGDIVLVAETYYLCSDSSFWSSIENPTEDQKEAAVPVLEVPSYLEEGTIVVLWNYVNNGTSDNPIYEYQIDDDIETIRENYINYLVALFYRVKGTRKVNDYVMEYEIIDTNSITYTVTSLEMTINSLPEGIDPNLFLEYLEAFYSSLLYFGNININIDEAYITINNTGASYINTGQAVFQFYDVTANSEDWEDPDDRAQMNAWFDFTAGTTIYSYEDEAYYTYSGEGKWEELDTEASEYTLVYKVPGYTITSYLYNDDTGEWEVEEEHTDSAVRVGSLPETTELGKEVYIIDFTVYILQTYRDDYLLLPSLVLYYSDWSGKKKYLSSSSNIVSINSINGKLVDIGLGAAGTTVISAELTKDDQYKDYTASYNITVEKEQREISFSEESITIESAASSISVPTLAFADGTSITRSSDTVIYSSDSSYLSVDKTSGALTVEGYTEDKITITATLSATSIYAASTAEYTVSMNHSTLSGFAFYYVEEYTDGEWTIVEDQEVSEVASLVGSGDSGSSCPTSPSEGDRFALYGSLSCSVAFSENPILPVLYYYASSDYREYDSSCLTYSSDNTSVATVDSSGSIEQVDIGETTISVEAGDDGFYDTSSIGSDSYTLTIENGQGQVVLELNEAEFSLDESPYSVGISTIPSTATLSASSDSSEITPSISESDRTLVLTASSITSSAVVVTVTSEKTTKYSSASDTCSVSVTKGYPKVSISSTTYTFTMSDDLGSVVGSVIPESLSEYGTYSSSDESVVTVDETTGALTAVAPGSSTITYSIADSTNWNSGSASCNVIVTRGDTSIVLSPSTQSIVFGSSGETISVTTTPEGLSYSLTSSNTNVATIDSDGSITTTGIGTTTITGLVEETSSFKSSTGTCSVTVLDGEFVPSFTDDSLEVTVLSDTLYLSLDSSTIPSDYTGDITYSSSDTSLVVVDSSTGVIEVSDLLGTGEVTITAAFTEDFYYSATSCSYTLTVGKVTTSLSYESSEVTVSASTTTVENTLTVTPTSASSLIDYSSGDSSVATVDSSGTVTVVSPGTTTITATISESTFYSGSTTSFTLTVRGFSTAEFSEESVSVTILDYDSVSVPTLTYTSGYSGTPSYSSSDTDYVTVDSETGEITGVYNYDNESVTVTITATLPETSTYYGSSATYSVVIAEEPYYGVLEETDLETYTDSLDITDAEELDETLSRALNDLNSRTESLEN